MPGKYGKRKPTTRRRVRSSRNTSRGVYSNATLTKIVKRMPKPEVKSVENIGGPTVISSAGYEWSPFMQYALGTQGLQPNQRVGNDVLWKSWYEDLIFRSSSVSTGPAMIRAVLYIPKTPTNSLTNDNLGVYDFINVQKYIVIKDIRFEVMEGAGNASSTGGHHIKQLKMGKRFKKPMPLHYASNVASQPEQQLMKWHFVSDISPSGPAPNFRHKHVGYFFDA